MAAARSQRRRRSVAPGVVHPARRARFLLLGILVVLSLFAAQLVRLQGLDAGSLSAAAQGERLATRAIPAERGSIQDRNGLDLAHSVERKRVVADPTLVETFTLRRDGKDVAEGYAAAAQVIAEVTDVDEATLLKRLTEPGSPRYTVLLPDASPLEWQEIRAAGIPGLAAEDLMRRDYPLGEAASPLLGWLGAGDQPSGGMELVFDEDLTGTPGRATYEQGRLGEVITTGLYDEEPAVPGRALRLTLDNDLQWRTYDAVKKRVEESNGVSGYGAVMDARTGELLALASYPGFDPADTAQDPEDMRNVAIEDVYEPGSTFKLITAAAALEEGIVEPDTPVEVPRSLSRGGTSFRDSVKHDGLDLTFAGVLAQSSNMGTILVGEQLSDSDLYDWARKFGMGQTVELGLPGESAGLLPPVDQWSATTRYTFMFGQGLSGTLLQQLSVFQTIANGGVRVPPSIVAGQVDADGEYVPRPAPGGTRVISEETAAELTRIMESVPSTSGTAPTAAVPGYHVAGKTSTATRVNPETGRYGGGGTTASFMGFAPAEDPRFVVGIVVQNPRSISEFGGVISGPVFSDVMRYALQQDGVPPATEEADLYEMEFDREDPAPGEPGRTLGDIAVKDEEEGE